MSRFAPKQALLAVIRLYRKIRPRSTVGCCKYIPTCSEYGLVAIERFGALKGGLTATAGGITAALFFGVIAALLFKSKPKR